LHKRTSLHRKAEITPWIKYQLRDFKGKGWCLAEPKDQSWRTLPVFNQRVWEILRRRQITGKPLRKPLPIEGSERTIDDLVFVNRDGAPVNDDYLQRENKRVLKQAGLPYINEHKLRTTFATRAVHPCLLHHNSSVSVLSASHYGPDDCALRLRPCAARRSPPSQPRNVRRRHLPAAPSPRTPPRLSPRRSRRP
jgi:hypothetical protein